MEIQEKAATVTKTDTSVLSFTSLLCRDDPSKPAFSSLAASSGAFSAK
ncbi:hypothetical protein [uncultured Desulfovibrio sp.]|nr:hypothetical protein [uncultured Desulfovibrio sp.]